MDVEPPDDVSKGEYDNALADFISSLHDDYAVRPVPLRLPAHLPCSAFSLSSRACFHRRTRARSWRWTCPRVSARTRWTTNSPSSSANLVRASCSDPVPSVETSVVSLTPSDRYFMSNVAFVAASSSGQKLRADATSWQPTASVCCLPARLCLAPSVSLGGVLISLSLAHPLDK